MDKSIVGKILEISGNFLDVNYSDLIGNVGIILDVQHFMYGFKRKNL